MRNKFDEEIKPLENEKKHSKGTIVAFSAVILTTIVFGEYITVLVHFVYNSLVDMSTPAKTEFSVYFPLAAAIGIAAYGALIFVVTYFAFRSLGYREHITLPKKILLIMVVVPVALLFALKLSAYIRTGGTGSNVAETFFGAWLAGVLGNTDTSIKLEIGNAAQTSSQAGAETFIASAIFTPFYFVCAWLAARLGDRKGAELYASDSALISDSLRNHS